ncbi:hypothetical protein U3516DRAFT_812195 [Neocallimastix sp. 'constans']
MDATLVQMKKLIKKSLNLSFSSSLIKKKKESKNQIIPNEILFKIFSYCDINTLFHSIPYVSHHWNNLLTKMSFAGQINIKIFDDQQFKKLFSKMKSSYSNSNSFSLLNSSYSYGGYSSYKSYGGFCEYTNYKSYDGYGSYNDYEYNYGYGKSSRDYITNQHNKEKDILNDLKPDYKIKLLDSKKTNSEVSIPIVFQIDLSLPLSFITVDQEEQLINDRNDRYNFNNFNQLTSTEEYSMINIRDNGSSSSYSSSSSSNQDEISIKEVFQNFDLEPIQNSSISTNSSSESTIEGGLSHSNNNLNSEVLGLSGNLHNESNLSSSSSLTPMVINSSSATVTTEEETNATPTPTQPENVLPNKTMILAELFLEKYKFTPEILKIQNVQWSEKFIHSIPRSVQILDLKYLDNPDAESIKNGTNYLHSFIKNLSISSSSLLRPRTRRSNRFYRPSIHRSTVVFNNLRIIKVNNKERAKQILTR